MPTRFTPLAALITAAALTTTAQAQDANILQTELGRIVPSSFGTPSLALLDSDNTPIALLMVAVTEPSSEPLNLLSESMPNDRWEGVISLHSDDANDEASGSSEESGFFASNTGRATVASLAGLAGAGYFALRGNDAVAAQPSLYYSVASASEAAPSTPIVGGPYLSLPDTPTATVAPEPATVALMGAGLAVLALAARKRRAR